MGLYSGVQDSDIGHGQYYAVTQGEGMTVHITRRRYREPRDAVRVTLGMELGYYKVLGSRIDQAHSMGNRLSTQSMSGWTALRMR